LENKPGHVTAHQPPILERLQIELKRRRLMTQNFESRFKGLIGACYALNEVCRK
jgi:hypothetical protein